MNIEELKKIVFEKTQESLKNIEFDCYEEGYEYALNEHDYVQQIAAEHNIEKDSMVWLDLRDQQHYAIRDFWSIKRENYWKLKFIEEISDAIKLVGCSKEHVIPIAIQSIYENLDINIADDSHMQNLWHKALDDVFDR